MVKVVKPALISVALIFVGSLIATGIGFSIPTEKTEMVTLVNYSHRGWFSYQGYSTASQPAPVLFPRIIEEMEILFSYSWPKPGEVEMKLILEDRDGNWQKEIPIETSGVSPISFPLNLSELLELGDAINEELGGRGRGGYLLRIFAEVRTESEPFIAVLAGELSSFSLTWQEDGFNKIQRGFPGGDDWRQGAFGYRVKLKENELFGPITLERRPDVPTPVAVEPEFPLFTHLVELVEIDFNYQFDSDVQINSLTQQAQVEIVVAEPGRWRRSFTLLEPTNKQGNFTVNFPLDIDKLREMAESISRERGGRGGKELEITIFAQVHTIANTNYGTIDEVFNHQLRGTIGETIEWEGGGTGGEGLPLMREGVITKQITEHNFLAENLRKSSLIGLGVSLPILLTLAFLYYSARPKPSFLKEELKRNRKKYGELISEVSDLLPIRDTEVIIRASSLQALANISNNSLKPILLKLEPDKHTYYVIDGLLRYEYVSKLKLPAKGARN